MTEKQDETHGQDPQPDLPLIRPSEGPSSSEPLKVVDRRWWVNAGDRSATEAEPARKPSYVEELERRLREKDELVQRARASFKEAEADFEQARVRLRREIAKDVERARRELLAEFLEVADNLDRAIEAARASAEVQDLRAGVEMVRAQMLGTLKSFGVARMDAIGQPFDPTRHEAISTVETPDPEAHETVVAVIKDGYVIGEELLRPAVVTVAKAPVARDTRPTDTPAAGAPSDPTS